MTHYQKLITIIFRFIGVVLIVFELGSWLSRLTKILLAKNFLEPNLQNLLTPFEAYFPDLTFLVIGTIALTYGRYFAKLICYDFDEK